MRIAEEYKETFDSAVARVKQEVAALRTGRANPAIVEDIAVEAYGTKQPLKALATILASDPKTITIEPWDKSVILAIDSCLRGSGLGFNPVNDGKLIRLPLPELTSDRRIELMKVLHQKLEAGRIAVRQIREEGREMIQEAEKAKEIGEDEKYREFDALEELVKNANDRLKTIGEEKEREIKTV